MIKLSLQMFKVQQTQLALDNKGYNGTFIVAEIVNDKEFRYSPTDTLV